MLKTAEEYLELFEQIYKKFRLEYYDDDSMAGLELYDLNCLAVQTFGDRAYVFELGPIKSEIVERLDKEIPV